MTEIDELRALLGRVRGEVDRLLRTPMGNPTVGGERLAKLIDEGLKEIPAPVEPRAVRDALDWVECHGLPEEIGNLARLIAFVEDRAKREADDPLAAVFLAEAAVAEERRRVLDLLKEMVSENEGPLYEAVRDGTAPRSWTRNVYEAHGVGIEGPPGSPAGGKENGS